jgi:hypothetical protein
MRQTKKTSRDERNGTQRSELSAHVGLAASPSPFSSLRTLRSLRDAFSPHPRFIRVHLRLKK